MYKAATLDQILFPEGTCVLIKGVSFLLLESTVVLGFHENLRELDYDKSLGEPVVLLVSPYAASDTTTPLKTVFEDGTYAKTLRLKKLLDFIKFFTQRRSFILQANKEPEEYRRLKKQQRQAELAQRAWDRLELFWEQKEREKE